MLTKFVAMVTSGIWAAFCAVATAFVISSVVALFSDVQTSSRLVVWVVSASIDAAIDASVVITGCLFALSAQ